MTGQMAPTRDLDGSIEDASQRATPMNRTTIRFRVSGFYELPEGCPFREPYHVE